MADDILIFGCGDTLSEALVDHNINLKNLFLVLRQENCKLNRAKMNLCKHEVHFFGNILSRDGLKCFYRVFNVKVVNIR